MATLGVATLMLVTALIFAILWRIGIVATFLFGGVIAGELAHKALAQMVDSGVAVWAGTVLAYSVGASICFVLLKLMCLLPNTHPRPSMRRLLLGLEAAVVVAVPFAMGWEVTTLIVGGPAGLFDIGMSARASVMTQVLVGLVFVFAAHRHMWKRRAANDDRPMGASPARTASEAERRRDLAA